MQELYSSFVKQGNPLIFMDNESAELTKYAANSFLATKISFMNEISQICEKLGANIDLIRKELEKIDNLHLLGRFGVGDYDNSDYAILNGLNLSDYLSSKISKIEYTQIRSATSQEKIIG